jgi:transcriptional regulator with XRE-family HTH domain
MSFSKRLREIRELKGLSREELAERSGLSRGAVRDYEQGHREPSLRSACQLADALGVKVDEMRNGREDAADAPPLEGRPRKAAGGAREGPEGGRVAGKPAGAKQGGREQGRKQKGKV